MKTIKKSNPQPITQKVTFYQNDIDKDIIANELTFELTFESVAQALSGVWPEFESLPSAEFT